MKRVVAVVVALALAGVLAWMVASAGDPSGTAVCVSFERRLQSGDVASARRIRDEAARSAPAHVLGYLDALLLLTAGKDAEAAAKVESVYAGGGAARDEWRIVSLLFTTRVNAGRPGEAWVAVDRFLAAHPADERAHVTAAQYWIEVRADDPDPDQAAAFLDRAARVPARSVPDDDPTAVRTAFVESLRSRVEQTRGRTGSAVAAAERRVAAEPASVQARVQLGEALRQAQKLPEARQAYREARRLAPEDLRIAKQLALLLLETDDTGPEVEPLTAWIQAREPQGVDARILRARALVRADRTDEAIDLYRELRAEEIPVPQRREVLRNLAVALYDWKQAGKKGDLLSEAHVLLREYRALGGEIDLRLRDTWETLEALSKNTEGPPK